MKIRTNPLSVKDIAKLARGIREYFNIPLDSFFPIYDYVMDLYDKDELDYVILEDDDEAFSDGKVAFYNSMENTIYIKDSVDLGFETNDYRSNFTLAHELFHYMQVNILEFDFEEIDDSEELKPFRNPEWQADEFAGQLLIPDEYASLDENELSEKFHVSLECALTKKLKIKKRKEKLDKKE